MPLKKNVIFVLFPLLVAIALGWIFWDQIFVSDRDSPFVDTTVRESQKRDQKHREKIRSSKNVEPSKTVHDRKTRTLPPQKKDSRPDFILISPDPVLIGRESAITLQAFGYQLKKPSDQKPDGSSDPGKEATRKIFEEKYISLGPVPVQWKISIPGLTKHHEDFYKRKDRHLYRFFFCEILPHPRDLSKAILRSLVGEGMATITAIYQKDPTIQDQSRLVVWGLYSNPRTKEASPNQKKIPTTEITIAPAIALIVYKEEGDLLIGWIDHRIPGNSDFDWRTNTQVWKRPLFQEASDLSLHKEFLEKLKKTVWKGKRPFSYYETELIWQRYMALARTLKYNSSTPYSTFLRGVRPRLEEHIYWEVKTLEAPPIPREKTIIYLCEQAPDRVQNILRIIQNPSDTHNHIYINHLIDNKLDKNLRNQLHPGIRNILEAYRRKLKTPVTYISILLIKLL